MSETKTLELLVETLKAVSAIQKDVTDIKHKVRNMEIDFGNFKEVISKTMAEEAQHITISGGDGPDIGDLESTTNDIETTVDNIERHMDENFNDLEKHITKTNDELKVVLKEITELAIKLQPESKKGTTDGKPKVTKRSRNKDQL